MIGGRRACSKHGCSLQSIVVALLVATVQIVPCISFTPTSVGSRSLHTTLKYHQSSRRPTPQNRILSPASKDFTKRRDVQCPPRLNASVAPASSGAMGTFYMLLLALQFAFQPILTKAFAPTTIIKGTYVLMQDFLRLTMCLTLLVATGGWKEATFGWTLSGAWVAAGFPALLYLAQNYCSLAAYQNLPPITYNVLNQTKTLSAAVWCFLIMRQLQSQLQIVSLGLLLVSALTMESLIPLPFLGSKAKEKRAAPKQRSYIKSGVVPVLLASLISGLAGAWTQKSLQQMSRNALLLSVELSMFSSFFFILTLLAGSPDMKRIQKEGLTTGWTYKTWIPLLVNAAGGILVGLVTKYAGAVRKGFALIMGMFLSGLLQNYVAKKDNKVSVEQWVGGCLAAISLWMHAAFPVQ